MAEESLLFGDRVWFHDVRTPVRRMAVSTHAEHDIVILSTWLGDTCTGTFRLPLSEAASLISVLAEGMARRLPAGGPAAPPSTPPLSERLPAPSRGWWDRLQARLRRTRVSSDRATAAPLRRIK